MRKGNEGNVTEETERDSVSKKTKKQKHKQQNKLLATNLTAPNKISDILNCHDPHTDA